MKISEEELKQIIVEALQEEDLEEGIISALRGAIGKIGGDAKNAVQKGAAAAKKYGTDVKKAAVEASVEGDINALSKRIEKIITKLSATGNKEALGSLDNALTAMAKSIEQSIKDIENPDRAREREAEADRDAVAPAQALADVDLSAPDDDATPASTAAEPGDTPADDEPATTSAEEDDFDPRVDESRRLNEGQVTRFAKLAGLTKGE